MTRKSMLGLPAWSLISIFTSLSIAAVDEVEGAGTCTVEKSSCLLQQQRKRMKAPWPPALEPTDPASQRARLQKAMPMAWFHVPKCGSSVVNFLVHLPDACPQIPDDLVISFETFGNQHALNFSTTYRVMHKDGACPGSFAHFGEHDGVEPVWDTVYKGHAMGMFRQPEQRLLSGYATSQHSWPSDSPARNELEYAERLQGCMVRMLVHGGGEKESCGGRDHGAPTDEELALAEKRLRTGFAFVGLTDQWVLSMCLGHRMFGGKCRTSDFIDTRVTGRNGEKMAVKIVLHPRPYDTSSLSGWTDPFDGALYKVAEEIFADNIARYNVSLESCQSCFKEAGIEIDDSDIA